MNSEKLGYIEAIGLISIIIIHEIVLNIPKKIIDKTGSSSWLNIIFITIITIIIVCIISKCFKQFKNFDILDISNFLGGKLLKNIIGISFLTLFFLSALIVLKNTTGILQLIYFENTPITYITLFFIICIIVANTFSIKVIAKTNLLILPLLIISIFVILISSIKNFVPQLIFPILGYGAEQTFINGLTNLFAFSGIGYLLFLNPLLNKTSDFKKISLISVILSGLCLFFSILSLIFSVIFTLKSGEEFPIYLLSRSIEFGRFVQRVDAIFIFIWTLSSIVFLSINIFFCIQIFRKITNIEDTKTINYTMGLLLLAISIIPSSFSVLINYLEAIYQVISLILIFFLSLILLFGANLKLKHINKKKKNVWKTIILVRKFLWKQNYYLFLCLY